MLHQAHSHRGVRDSPHCLGCTEQQEGIGRTSGAKRNTPIPPSLHPSALLPFPQPSMPPAPLWSGHTPLVPAQLITLPAAEPSLLCCRASSCPCVPVALNLPAGPLPLNNLALNQVAPSAVAEWPQACSPTIVRYKFAKCSQFVNSFEACNSIGGK